MEHQAQILTEWILSLCLCRLSNFFHHSCPQPVPDPGVSDLALLGLSAFLIVAKANRLASPPPDIMQENIK
jgi:hypothetical protein